MKKLRKSTKLILGVFLVLVSISLGASSSHASSTIIDKTDFISGNYYVVFENQDISRKATIEVSLSVTEEISFLVCDGGKMVEWYEGGQEPDWYYTTSVTSYSSFSFELEKGKYDFVLSNNQDISSAYHLIVKAHYKGLTTTGIILIVGAVSIVLLPIAKHFENKKRQKQAIELQDTTAAQILATVYSQQQNINATTPVTEQQIEQQIPSKFCSNCGAKIDVKATFCTQCGAKQN